MNIYKKNKGFTLIELLVALAILSLLIVSFFTVVSKSIKSNAKNEKDIKAMNIIQTEVENIRKQIKGGNDIITSTNSIPIVLGENIIEERIIEGKSKNKLDKYRINILLNTVEGNESLYKLIVEVENINQNFSKKKSSVITQISGKSNS